MKFTTNLSGGIKLVGIFLLGLHLIFRNEVRTDSLMMLSHPIQEQRVLPICSGLLSSLPGVF